MIDLRGKTSSSVNSIMSLLRWIFSQTYCEYNGDYYSLDSGPIELGVTGELAIIYMEDFKVSEQAYWFFGKISHLAKFNPSIEFKTPQDKFLM